MYTARPSAVAKKIKEKCRKENLNGACSCGSALTTAASIGFTQFCEVAGNIF